MGVGSTIRLMGGCEERAEGSHEVLLLGAVTPSLSAGVLRTVGVFASAAQYFCQCTTPAERLGVTEIRAAPQPFAHSTAPHQPDCDANPPVNVPSLPSVDLQFKPFCHGAAVQVDLLLQEHFLFTEWGLGAAHAALRCTQRCGFGP